MLSGFLVTRPWHIFRFRCRRCAKVKQLWLAERIICDYVKVGIGFGAIDGVITDTPSL
jgi:hypothetical protein